MATSKNTGTAITPEMAGYGGMKAISLGDAPIKLAFALATTTSAREGVTLDEFRVRTLALGMPLWYRPVGKTDAMWIVRQPGTARSQRRGVTHVCAHNAKKGALENCIGGHAERGESCTFQFKSKGDSIRRWRNDEGAHEVPAFDSSAKVTAADARAAAIGHIKGLKSKGFKAADMLATKSIQWLISVELITERDLKPTTTRKSRAKVASPEPPAETAEGEVSEK